MTKFVDIDWNIYKIYDSNLNLIDQNYCTILRDLMTDEVIGYMENAKEKMKEDINILAINCVENKRVTSTKDLVFLIKRLEEKYGKIFLVDRYNISAENINSTNLIEEKKFLKDICLKNNSKNYIELRESEIIEFNSESEHLKVHKFGKIIIRDIVNSYFYLNKNCTLNTLKTKKLLKDISESMPKFVNCRNYESGIDEKIIINKKVITEMFDKISSIFHDINVNNEYSFNEDFKEIYKIVNWIDSTLNN